MANNLYKIYVTSNGEWETIELDELNIDTVFSVEEITDISQRKDNITKSITLKGTKQNNKVLGALYSLDREVDSNPDTTNLMFNYKPNKYLDCFVLENNIEIIRGKLLITSVDVRKGVIYYNCNIVGNVFSFFSNLNDKNLEHLDSLDVPENRSIRYGRETIRGSWNANTPVGNLNMLILEDTARGVLWTNGNILTEPTPANPYIAYHKYTDFIPANPSTPYTFTKTPSDGDRYFRIGFFDSGFNLIYRTAVQNAYSGETIISPAGTVYIRFSFPDGATNVKLEEGSEFTGYSRNPADYLDYVFPMINYGGRLLESGEDVSWDASKRRVRWTDYKPAIYVRSYIDAMFNGWRYDEVKDEYTQKSPSEEPLRQFRWSSSLKNDYAFNRLIIPFNNDYWRTNNFQDVEYTGDGPIFDYPDGLWKPLDNYGPLDSQGWKPIYTTVPNDIKVNDPWEGNVVSRLSEVINGINYPNIIRVSTPFRGTISVTGRVGFYGVNNFPGIDFPRVRVAIVKINSTTPYTFTDDDIVVVTTVQRNSKNDGPSDSSGENGTFNLSFTGLLDGDYAIVLKKDSDNATGWYLNGDSYINLVGSSAGVFEMKWGERFDIFSTVPTGYSCREFLKSVMLLNNLFMISDKEDDRLFHIYTYDEFNQKMLNRVNTGEAIDWSDKIDWETYSLSSNLRLSKGYNFTYKEEEDYWNEYYTENTGRTYGDFKLIDSAGLIESHTTEVIFSPTMNLDWKFNSQIPQAYKADTFGGGEPPESYKGGIRLLYFVGGVKLGDDITTNNRGYNLVDDLGNMVDVFNPFNGYYGYASMNLYEITTDSNGNNSVGTMIDSLMFGRPAVITLSGDFNASVETPSPEFTKYKYNTHHRSRIRELTDPNLITMEADAYLNEGDIARLDFRTPIYIQSPFGSAYFKLLRVEYSDSNSTSRVTLQKVVLPDSNIK